MVAAPHYNLTDSFVAYTAAWLCSELTSQLDKATDTEMATA